MRDPVQPRVELVSDPADLEARVARARIQARAQRTHGDGGQFDTGHADGDGVTEHRSGVVDHCRQGHPPGPLDARRPADLELQRPPDERGRRGEVLEQSGVAPGGRPASADVETELPVFQQEPRIRGVSGELDRGPGGPGSFGPRPVARVQPRRHVALGGADPVEDRLEPGERRAAEQRGRDLGRFEARDVQEGAGIGEIRLAQLRQVPHARLERVDTRPHRLVERRNLALETGQVVERVAAVAHEPGHLESGRRGQPEGLHPPHHRLQRVDPRAGIQLAHPGLPRRPHRVHARDKGTGLADRTETVRRDRLGPDHAAQPLETQRRQLDLAGPLVHPFPDGAGPGVRVLDSARRLARRVEAHAGHRKILHDDLLRQERFQEEVHRDPVCLQQVPHRSLRVGHLEARQADGALPGPQVHGLQVDLCTHDGRARPLDGVLHQGVGEQPPEKADHQEDSREDQQTRGPEDARLLARRHAFGLNRR